MATPDERYRLLIEQVCEDYKIDQAVYGWKSKVARVLHVEPSTINKFLADKRGAGEDIRDAAAEALHFDARFFKVPDLGERPRYSDWKMETRTERATSGGVAPAILKFFRENQGLARFMPDVIAGLQGHSGIDEIMVIKAVHKLQLAEAEKKRQTTNSGSSRTRG
jgi:transcriptional regulator with XRE-family HTH domain